MKRYLLIDYSLLAKLLGTGVLLAVSFSFYYQREIAAGSPCVSWACLLLWAYGDLDIGGIRYLMPLFFWILPQLGLLYFLGDDLAKNLERNAVYIFTRTSRRTAWWLAISFRWFCYIFFYYAVQLATLYLMARILGFRGVDGAAGLTLLWSEIALLVLLNYMILLLIHLLSLYMSHIFAFVIVTGGNIATLFLAALLYELGEGKAIQWLPFTQGILSWHTGFDRYVLHSLPSAEVPIWFSLLYLGLACLLLLLGGAQKWKKMDII
jgi:hypothetical protein